MTLLLASKSETRRRMLEEAGVRFELASADLDEDKAKNSLVEAGLAPVEIADRLAELKGISVAAPLDSLVLGSDQTLETADGRLLSKPRSREHAREQLMALAGRTHWLHSAAVIVTEGRRLWGASESVAMRMRPFGNGFVEHYLDREYEHVRWNVGAYRIEGMGVQLFDSIEGSHFAILGLPLLPLLAFLRAQGALQA